MANKKRRNKKIRRQQVAAAASRQALVAGAAGGTGAEPSGASTGSSPAAASAPARTPTYAAGVSGPRAKGQGTQTPQGTSIDIDSRVPYFASDLRRIAITAGILVAGIVVASFFIH
ncbi:MAG: hypothetical protein M3O87_02800 [Candidatus Dormibacteraeota bacterium]|nr:hypothetical protein [Candidatus Dormibacteraeota bacterium]